MQKVMQKLLLLILASCLYACDSSIDAPEEATAVTDWHLTIHLPDVALPVQLHLAVDGSEAWFTNGAEKVIVPEVTMQADTVKLYFPSFNNTLLLHRNGAKLKGDHVRVVLRAVGNSDIEFQFLCC